MVDALTVRGDEAGHFLGEVFEYFGINHFANLRDGEYAEQSSMQFTHRFWRALSKSAPGRCDTLRFSLLCNKIGHQIR